MAFVFVSGRPCLDLAGTLKWRRRDEPEEQLTAPGLLADWAVQCGLADDAFPVDDLARAIGVREAVYRSVVARIAGSAVRPADAALLNSLARQSPIALEVLPDGTVRRLATLPRLLTTIALDALDLLGGDTFGRVRECAGADCTRLYLDTSRSRNRRWCGMAECGNRAKVSAYRQRRAG